MRTTHGLLIALVFVIGCNETKTTSTTGSTIVKTIVKKSKSASTLADATDKTQGSGTSTDTLADIPKGAPTTKPKPKDTVDPADPHQPKEYVAWLRELDSGDKAAPVVVSIQNRAEVLSSLGSVPIAADGVSEHLLQLVESKLPARFAYGMKIHPSSWRPSVSHTTSYLLDEHHDPATSQPEKSDLDPFTVFVQLSGTERPSQLIVDHEAKHDIVAVFSQPSLELLAKLSLSAITDKGLVEKLTGVEKHVKQGLVFVDYLDSISIRAIFVTTNVEKTQQLLGVIQEHWRSEIGKVTASVADTGATDEERAAAAIRLGQLTTAYDTLDFVASDNLLEIRLSLPRE